ncbi:MAG: hypothetical protein ACOY3Y_13865, partial [Acidobacteriota bacterium]
MTASAQASPGTALQATLDRLGWSASVLARGRVPLPPDQLDTALRIALALSGRADQPDLESWRQALYLESRRKLFPSRFPEPDEATREVASYFFPLAHAVLLEQRASGRDGIAERLAFAPLVEREVAPWPSADEYRRALRHIEHEGMLVAYAMAQQWLGFSIADHILGVTSLALWVGRQMAGSIPVDLPLLHGASIGHDIGKFGCIGDEERRIPRLHYYYTHVWYKTRGLPGLGHIATNHSCWDLEQVRLPIETLLLIYADFRVKDSTRVYGVKRMSIISLKDAFAEIRDKLENLDEAKLRRYEAVYRKLRDLEDYALALGVQLDPPGFGTLQPPRPKLPKGLSVTDVMAGRQRPDVVSLVRGPQVATVARFFTTAHNIGVMERLRDLPALRHLLEEARSFEGWRDLRTYLGVLGEYAPALSMEQKELALEFFFDLLGHGDDDIRYHAANRIGDLLALGEDFWRKDLPEGVAAEGDDWVLTQLDKVMALLERAGTEAEEDMGPTETVLYAIPIVVRRLVSRARGRIRDDALDRILARLEARVGDDRPLVALYACECCEVLAPHARPSDHERMAALAEARARHATVNARLMAWRALLALARERQDAAVRQSARTAVRRLVGTLAEDALVAELFLLEELSTALDLPEAAARCSEALGQRRDAIQTVMLRNLKSRVGWVEKKVNCDYLVAVALSGVARSTDSGAYFANEVAGHLANLLKVSRVEGTRFHAGRSLLRLLPALTVTQRNDLAVELLRALQLDAESVTRYIPRFLGSVVASLPDQEFLEILDDVEADLRRGNEPLQRLLLQTADWILLSLGEERLEGGVMRRLAGMFLGALAETRSSTVHEGYAEIAMVLERLAYDGTRDRRLPLFLQLVTKKLLTLVTHRPADRGRFFLIASALNHLDRAIERERRRLRLPARPTVALVPGTFDPFTLAHAEVVSRLLSHADEVLIQVDDYSWNKHAQ